MGEVDDEDELNQDEESRSDHAEIHPNFTESLPVAHEERGDHETEQEHILETPEAVLYARSSVIRASNSNHHGAHHDEEHGQSEHDAVHREVTDDFRADLRRGT